MKEKSGKGGGFRHTIKNTLYLLGLVKKISPERIVVVFVQNLLGYGWWTFASVGFMRFILGALDMNLSFGKIALFIGIAMLFALVHDVFQAWIEERFVVINNQKLYRGLNKIIFDKATNVELGCYEDSDFYNNYTKASIGIFENSVQAVYATANLFAALFSSAIVVGSLFSINIYIGLFAIIPIVVNLFFGMKEGKVEYDKNMEQVPFTRKQDYVNRAVYLQKYTKELRLTNIFGVLTNTYEKATQEHIAVSKKHRLRLSLFYGLKNLICFPVFFEGTWLLSAFFAMVTKTISTSDFVIAATSAVNTTWMLFNITDGLVNIFKQSLYADNLTEFLSYKEKIPEDQDGIDVPEKIESLEFKNVSFKYKDDLNYVLKNINLNFKSGEIISLVGHNGSGKSTLVKLMMRLYDVSEGEILLNGTNVKKYNLKAYRALIGATFQDYQIFADTVTENVVMGNKTNGEAKASAVHALKESGIYDEILEFPNGTDTMLTKEFDDDGVQFSGGGEQKIAIARAFAKASSILLLDEPSSALDPIAEYNMHKNFVSLCRENNEMGGKISIFISHRLSSAAVADHIYLLDNGEVLECGSHSQLMSSHKTYYEMFNKQAENYLIGGLQNG